MYADWGLRVRERREAQGLTQRDLADAALVSQQMISGVERGILAPSDATKRAVAVALHTRPRDLFPFPEDREPTAATA